MQLLVEQHPEDQDQFHYSVIVKEIEIVSKRIFDFREANGPVLILNDIRSIIAELRPIIKSEACHFNIEATWNIIKEPSLVHCTKD
ncbi:hypothetical protein IOC57_04815 [Bacillus sp. SD075]|uniref:hypothetical protein n=1 Tax=Bacillus sp. SD075 TaxID=2781732 RepID=UPI001A966C89|nr:hypothetical protein [Bacillus sp. SD075]MBO0997085.1 hypothetical protein [Bacillus sp. SD075]